MGKGKIARNEQFLHFPQCFPLNHIIVSPFVHIYYIMYSFTAELEEPKVDISGKALKWQMPDQNYCFSPFDKENNFQNCY